MSSQRHPLISFHPKLCLSLALKLALSLPHTPFVLATHHPMSLSSLTTSPGPKPFPPRSRPTSPPISQAHDEAQRYQRLFKLTEYQVLRLRIPTQKSAEGIWTRQGNRAGIRRQLEPEIDCGPPIRTKAMDVNLPRRVILRRYFRMMFLCLPSPASPRRHRSWQGKART